MVTIEWFVIVCLYREESVCWRVSCSYGAFYLRSLTAAGFHLFLWRRPWQCKPRSRVQQLCQFTSKSSNHSYSTLKWEPLSLSSFAALSLTWISTTCCIALMWCSNIKCTIKSRVKWMCNKFLLLCLWYRKKTWNNNNISEMWGFSWEGMISNNVLNLSSKSFCSVLN